MALKIIHEVRVTFCTNGDSNGDHNLLHNVFQVVKSIYNQNQQIMDELTVLTQEVTETKTVMASAVTLLQGLKARLDAAGTDKVKLAELSADLDTNTNALAAAVAANTPAENEPTPENGGEQPA